MKINWREISACNYCSNYNSKESYCKGQKKELTIYEELKGCEAIVFTGSPQLDLFSEIPKDSVLRKLSIEHLSKSNPKLINDITSKEYGDYFNSTKSVEGNLNLSKSEGEGKIISFEKFNEAQRKLEETRALNNFLHLSDHLDL
jgi:hypothetical protein